MNNLTEDRVTNSSEKLVTLKRKVNRKIIIWSNNKKGTGDEGLGTNLTKIQIQTYVERGSQTSKNSKRVGILKANKWKKYIIPGIK